MNERKKAAGGSLISRRRMLYYGLAGIAGIAGGFRPVSAFGKTPVMNGTKTGGGLEKIASIHIGVAKNIAINKDFYTITLDNNIYSNIPLHHPIRETYINPEIRFPHFTNDAIALVSYDNGISDWLPARIAVSGFGGGITIGTNRYTFKDLTYEQCMELTLQAQQEGSSAHYGTLAVLPVPSPYKLHFNEQFSEHNYTLIKEMLMNPDKNITIDVAYSYSEGVGYSIVYVQPTRFTPQYCRDAGIRTNHTQ